MELGIVGYGTVGKHLERLFSRAGFSVSIYDKYIDKYCSRHAKKSVQSSELVFLAVPTPESSSGEIDLSSVEEAVSWLRPPICIKSTVVPGTTSRLISLFNKSIVFSPEYVGETPYHKYSNDLSVDLVVFGGSKADSIPFASVYRQALGPIPQYFFTDPVTAELSKYMENCFFATKLTFVAQFHALASSLGADFDQMREIWVADTRVGRSHSIIVNKPGFSGKCLPKDLAAMVALASQYGGAPFLEAVQAYNRSLLDKRDKPS
jgi:UDPglucose 6-dehydrogenase